MMFCQLLFINSLWELIELLSNYHNKNQIKWRAGDVPWEPLSSCKDLETLDNYLDEVPKHPNTCYDVNEPN